MFKNVSCAVSLFVVRAQTLMTNPNDSLYNDNLFICSYKQMVIRNGVK